MDSIAIFRGFSNFLESSFNQVLNLVILTSSFDVVEILSSWWAAFCFSSCITSIRMCGVVGVLLNSSPLCLSILIYCAFPLLSSALYHFHPASRGILTGRRQHHISKATSIVFSVFISPSSELYVRTLQTKRRIKVSLF